MQRAFTLRCRETQEIRTAAKIRKASSRAVAAGRNGALAGAAPPPGPDGQGRLGAPRPGTTANPRQRASPGVLLFWGLRGERVGWRGPHLLLFAQRGQQKTLRLYPQDLWAGAAAAPGCRLGPFSYGPSRSYRPGRTAEWPPDWDFWSLLHRGWWGCWGHDPGAAPPFFYPPSQARFLRIQALSADQVEEKGGKGTGSGRERGGGLRRSTEEPGLIRRAREPQPRRRPWQKLRGVCGSKRPTENPREGGRRALPAGRRHDARGTCGRKRGARTRAKGRAHLLARGAPLPGPSARTRPRWPSRHGSRNPAREALDGRRAGTAGASGCRALARPFLLMWAVWPSCLPYSVSRSPAWHCGVWTGRWEWAGWLFIKDWKIRSRPYVSGFWHQRATFAPTGSRAARPPYLVGLAWHFPEQLRQCEK